MEAGAREMMLIFKVVKEENRWPRIPRAAEMSFRNEDRIKSYQMKGDYESPVPAAGSERNSKGSFFDERWHQKEIWNFRNKGRATEVLNV